MLRSVRLLRQSANIGYVRGARRTLTSEKDDSRGASEEEEDLSIDELTAPTNCCMSGCANCVWIEYATKLQRKLVTSDEEVRKIIMEKVEDPNMRAFLMMELRNLDPN